MIHDVTLPFLHQTGRVIHAPAREKATHVPGQVNMPDNRFGKVLFSLPNFTGLVQWRNEDTQRLAVLDGVTSGSQADVG